MGKMGKACEVETCAMTIPIVQKGSKSKRHLTRGAINPTCVRLRPKLSFPPGKCIFLEETFWDGHP
jgi:hypothetical protein